MELMEGLIVQLFAKQNCSLHPKDNTVLILHTPMSFKGPSSIALDYDLM